MFTTGQKLMKNTEFENLISAYHFILIKPNHNMKPEKKSIFIELAAFAQQ
jgi:hypothetical protein